MLKVKILGLILNWPVAVKLHCIALTKLFANQKHGYQYFIYIFEKVLMATSIVLKLWYRGSSAYAVS